jgi:GntR family transcriptional regulator
MVLELNFKSSKPVYLQMVDQIKEAAAAGSLRPGEPLPSIRPLAEQLRVNRNTVAKAYEELERQGILETAPGRGCFLKENGSPFKREVRDQLLSEEIDGLIVQAHHLQVDRTELVQMVHQRYDLFDQRRANALNR